MAIVGIFIVIAIILGIIKVQERYDTEGVGKAFKSLFCLFMALIGVALCFSGIGAVIGVPIIGCIAKEFGKRV